jgi:hypothetical protein
MYGPQDLNLLVLALGKVEVGHPCSTVLNFVEHISETVTVLLVFLFRNLSIKVVPQSHSPVQLRLHLT